MKTYKQWLRVGRVVRNGETARAYLMDDEQLHGAALFDEDQTQPDDIDNPHDEWTVVVSVAEYRKIRAEARKLATRPKVRVDAGKDGGVSVWVGPNKEAIKWLKEKGYRFDLKSHRWVHPNKTAEQVATAWEQVPGYRVVREWIETDVVPSI